MSDAAKTPLSPARWRSGYAEDCKSLHAGSIPARASNHLEMSDLEQSLFEYGHPRPAPRLYGSSAVEILHLPSTEALQALCQTVAQVGGGGQSPGMNHMSRKT